MLNLTLCKFVGASGRKNHKDYGNPAFFTHPFLISTAAAGGDSDGGLALCSYMENKHKNEININKINENKINENKINENKINKTKYDSEN